MCGTKVKPILSNSRCFAAGVHLLFSLGIAALAASMVFIFWYPGAFRSLSGGQDLFFILVSVDVILGPLLTFTVFDVAKPKRELRTDVGLIVCVQIGALLYGLWTVYLARPVFFVYEIDRFQVVTAADIDPREHRLAIPQYQDLPFWGIQTIGVRRAVDEQERLMSLDLALAGKDIAMRPNWWQPLNEEHKKMMIERGRPVASLIGKSGYDSEAVDALLESARISRSDVLCFPVVARSAAWTVLINQNTMQVVGFIPVDGF